MTSRKYVFNERGQRLYYCLNCLDTGYIHPIKEDGRVDYSKAVKCSCRQGEQRTSDRKQGGGH